ncbi:hypothetical protein [Stieleria varia]|uniref:Uncharacterized protein n=1 Tax=Stieleria varia TaxID=2528005 RepID=A0A5C6B3G4_9BACT|nr:hypothetical protein [Stieleria varia]TWU06440.1 hypothetical protein Pla52n_21610 [Stieleria varia]
MPSTVDLIRRALEKKFGISEDEMRPLAEKFGLEVEKVNKRLDEAVDLLRKGLRSEAIQSISRVPNAMQAAAELEFPEVDEWHEILQFMGIPIPTTLNEDSVSQINEAIVESLPLDALMKRHRQLAIAKAPLAGRLKVLRQIGRRDAANPVWAEDIEDWEKDRLREIDQELDQAIASEDIRTVCALHTELTGQKWISTPPARLVEQASFVAEGHYQQVRENELKKIVAKMQSAFESADEAQTRKLVSLWQSRTKELKQPVAFELERRVKPIIAWLNEMGRKAAVSSQRTSAIAHLQTLMNSAASLNEIRAAHEKATQFDEPMPEDVSEQYRKLIQSDQSKKKLKSGLIFGGAGAAVLAIVVAVVTLMSSGKQQERLETAQSQLQSLVLDENWQQAQSFYERQIKPNADLAADPTIESLYLKVEGAMNVEKERAAQFRKFLEQADAEDPALIDGDLLRRAEKIALTDDELAAVEKMMQRKNQFNQTSASKITEQAMKELNAYQSELVAFTNRPADEATRQSVEGLYSRLQTLPKKYAGATPEFDKKYQELKAQTSATLRNIQQQMGQSDEYQRDSKQFATSRTLEEYRDALEAISNKATEIGLPQELKDSLQESAHWDAVALTNQWLQEIKSAVSNGVSPAEARDLLSKQKSLATKVNKNPILLRMSAEKEQLQEASGRDALLDSMFDRLKKHTLSDLIELRVSEPLNGNVEQRYFVNSTFISENRDRLTASGRVGFPVVDSVLGAVRNRSFEGTFSVTDEPQATMRWLEQQGKELRVEFLQDWEKTFVTLIANVVKRDKLDGLVKEVLVSMLIDEAAAGSEVLEEATRGTRDELKLRRSKRDNWFAARPPDSSLSADVRGLASSELMSVYAGSEERWKSLLSFAENPYQWIGMLVRVPDGPVRLLARDQLPGSDGDLLIAVESPADASKTDFVRIGRLEQGDAKLEPARSNLVPGRPVFFLAD